MAKILADMWETWVRSLGQEDPLKEVMATHSNILACLENPHGQKSLAAAVHGVSESDTTERLSISTCLIYNSQNLQKYIIRKH